MPRRSLPGRARGGGVNDAVVAPGAEEALAQRSRLGGCSPWRSPRSPLAGLVANAVPTVLVYAVGRRSMPPVTHATVKFLTAIVVFAAHWAILRWWVFDDTAQPWLLTLAVGSDLRARDALVRGEGCSGRGGRGWRPSGWCCRRARRPPHSAGFASSRPSELRHRRRRTARGRTGDMNSWDPEVRKLLRRLTDGQHDVLGWNLVDRRRRPGARRAFLLVALMFA